VKAVMVVTDCGDHAAPHASLLLGLPAMAGGVAATTNL